VVHYTRGSKVIGIGAGAFASVVAINPGANQVTVEKPNQELVIYDPRRLNGVSVYQEMERELSIGDRIQFTAPDKSFEGNMGSIQREDSAFYAKRRIANHDNQNWSPFLSLLHAPILRLSRPRRKGHLPMLP
jgi:hypothetical protein